MHANDEGSNQLQSRTKSVPIDSQVNAKESSQLQTQKESIQVDTQGSQHSGSNQLQSRTKYMPIDTQGSRHSVNAEESIQLQSQEESIQVDTQGSQHSGVTVVGYDVDVKYLLSLLKQHIESEFSRFTGNYLPITLDVNGHTFRVNIVGSNVGNPNIDLDDVYDESDLFHSRHATRIPTSTGVQDNIKFPSGGTRPSRTSLRSYHNCARGFEDTPYIEPFRLRNLKTCHHCGAKLFPSETSSLCCLNGKVKLPLLSPPPELAYLYTSQSAEGIHFRENIRSYNHVFSFTSMGVHIDDNLANGRDGVYTYRARGAIYHRIGGLLPQPGNRPRYLQMYIYDTDHELEYRLAERNILDRQVLAILKRVLDSNNRFVHIFREVSHHDILNNIRLHIKEQPPNRHQYSLPESSEVAAILVGGEEPSDMSERDIIVESKSGDIFNIPDTAGYYDPLQYPLLHPYGNFGWDLHIFSDNARRISCRAFYSYMLQIRDNHLSLLLRGGRLLQQYAVDNYVKIATQQLRFIRNNQDKIRAELYQGLHDSLAAGVTNTDCIE